MASSVTEENTEVRAPGTQGPPNVPRGRGRGIVSQRGKLVQGTREPQEQTVKQLLKQLQPSNIRNTVDCLTRPSVPHKCQEQLNEAIEIVCSNVLENIEFVEIGAKLLKSLWDSDLPDDVSSRKPLMSKIQKIYQARNNLTDTEFQNYATLLCELWSCLYIHDEPIIALNTPVYAILQEFLHEKGNSHDGIFTFHQVICRHGTLLAKQNKDKMSELMDKIRDMAISDGNNKIKKCILLEIIERHASGWNLPQSVENYYAQTLAELDASVYET